MTGDHIPDAERIARYCKGSDIDDDGFPSAYAFFLREHEGSLSVYLFDRFGGDSDQARLESLRFAVHNILLKLRKSGVLALLRVGVAKQHISAATNGERGIRVLHDPLIEPVQFDNHAGIYDTAADEWTIANCLLEVIETALPALSRQ